ncbi:MAG: MFS transporter [Acetobacteraceae bacterium]|nr:MFS transporter [Pseudomonadota bacterium]
MFRAAVGLNCLAFLTAAIQTGFGPFIAVWLTEQRWTFGEIGVALSIGTIAGVATQLPGGAFVDHVRSPRNVAAGALIGLGVAAALLSLPPSRPSVWGAVIEHAIASSVMTPVIAALTLSLCGHRAFSRRLGLNARYAALGSAASAALLGVVAEFISVRAVFVATLLLVVPALASLAMIRPDHHVDRGPHVHKALTPAREREYKDWNIFEVPALHVFAVAVLLFQFANASMLPLALSRLTQQGGAPGWVLSATIVLPQLITAALSPWAGAMAQRVGRRPVLLVGFAALPARGLLFALGPDPVPLVLIQALDGLSATVLGLMLPLIAADLTERSGYMNLAIGSLGLAGALGAALSTAVAGWIADHTGAAAAFTTLAAAGASAFALLWLTMPETRPEVPSGAVA